MGTVRIKNDEERIFLIKLLEEFGPRIIRPRKEKVESSEHYGILDVREDINTDDLLYDVALPEHYIKFFNYLMMKKRHPQLILPPR